MTVVPLADKTAEVNVGATSSPTTVELFVKGKLVNGCICPPVLDMKRLVGVAERVTGRPLVIVCISAGSVTVQSKLPLLGTNDANLMSTINPSTLKVQPGPPEL